MKYTARIVESKFGYFAQCVEVEALGEGATPEAAVESLRAELQDRLDPVEGVAPPSRSEPTVIEILVLNEPDRNDAISRYSDPA
jgi:hypothetical protein